MRFGGSRDSQLADMLDETREDLGLSHAQMEMLHVRVFKPEALALTRRPSISLCALCHRPRTDRRCIRRWSCRSPRRCRTATRI